MKTRVLFIFNLGDDRRAEMIEIAIDAGCAEFIREPDPFHPWGGYFSHTFDSKDPHLEMLRTFLRERGHDWIEHHEAKYAVAELEAFPLLALWVIRSPIRYGGAECGTEYDFSGACPECGTGAVQTSPLILPAGSVPTTGQIVCTCAGEILVADPLAEALGEAAITGVELRQVVARRAREALPWWQIMSAHEMPRMAPETLGIVRESCWTAISPICTFPPPCKRCRRDGHYRTIAEPMQIVYRRADVGYASIPDVVHTWENFGHSVRTANPAKHLFPGQAQPLILIKQHPFSIIRRTKVKYLRFDPVCIE